MKELFSFLKDLESKAGIILLTVLVCLSIYVTFQVTNHIPTQIKEINNKIDKLNDKIDNNHNEMNRNHNEIKNLFIEYLSNKK